ncbi:hypothetical protein [Nocardioides nanhaiensis]|uniref:Uncharacterized protein n=1 Tax=Nocardioides nanhaiensis TaxID=1476871 RepID=A0ABP8VXL8_9ACTN
MTEPRDADADEAATHGRRRVLLAAGGEAAGSLARELRDAGHEVVWVDVSLGAEALVRIALQEDVDEVRVGAQAPSALLAAVRTRLETDGAADVEVR